MIEECYLVCYSLNCRIAPKLVEPEPMPLIDVVFRILLSIFTLLKHQLYVRKAMNKHDKLLQNKQFRFFAQDTERSLALCM